MRQSTTRRDFPPAQNGLVVDYRVVCTAQSEWGRPGHGHIEAVGTGVQSASWAFQWSVNDVLQAMAAGHRFYTISQSSDGLAWIHPFDCSCGLQTIRSGPDAAPDNNLDALPQCLE